MRACVTVHHVYLDVWENVYVCNFHKCWHFAIHLNVENSYIQLREVCGGLNSPEIRLYVLL